MERNHIGVDLGFVIHEIADFSVARVIDQNVDFPLILTNSVEKFSGSFVFPQIGDVDVSLRSRAVTFVCYGFELILRSRREQEGNAVPSENPGHLSTDST